MVLFSLTSFLRVRW